jgi:hypothetical protein
MCLVRTTQPDRDAPIIPLGKRKAVMEKQRKAAATQNQDDVR